jgi:hypothetical protein
MSPAEFEPAIPASDRFQANALDRAATGIDRLMLIVSYKYEICRFMHIFCTVT